MKSKILIYSILLVAIIAACLFGISLYFQPNQSTLGIVIMLGSATLGAAAFISGINDSYDLIGKLKNRGEENESSRTEHSKNELQNSQESMISDFSELAQLIWPLVAENGRAFRSFGPNSGADTAEAVRWNLELWESAKSEIILPNNKQILQLIEDNENLVSAQYRAVFDQMRAHIFAFEKHCEHPDFSYSDNQFPVLFVQVIDEVCASEERSRNNLSQYEQWLNERFQQLVAFEISDAYFIGSSLRGNFVDADVDLFILFNISAIEEVKISKLVIEDIKEQFLLEFSKPLHVMAFTSLERQDYYDFLENVDRKKKILG